MTPEESRRALALDHAMKLVGLFHHSRVGDVTADAAAIERWLKDGGERSGDLTHSAPNLSPDLDRDLVIHRVSFSNDGGSNIGSGDVQADLTVPQAADLSRISVTHNESSVDGFGSQSTLGGSARIGNDPGGDTP